MKAITFLLCLILFLLSACSDHRLLYKNKDQNSFLNLNCSQPILYKELYLASELYSNDEYHLNTILGDGLPVCPAIIKLNLDNIDSSYLDTIYLSCDLDAIFTNPCILESCSNISFWDSIYTLDRKVLYNKVSFSATVEDYNTINSYLNKYHPKIKFCGKYHYALYKMKFLCTYTGLNYRSYPHIKDTINERRGIYCPVYNILKVFSIERVSMKEFRKHQKKQKL